MSPSRSSPVQLKSNLSIKRLASCVSMFVSPNPLPPHRSVMLAFLGLGMPTRKLRCFAEFYSSRWTRTLPFENNHVEGCVACSLSVREVFCKCSRAFFISKNTDREGAPQFRWTSRNRPIYDFSRGLSTTTRTTERRRRDRR